MAAIKEQNIVVLISGTGSNMQALVQAAQQRNWQQRFGARIAAVISNRTQAKGLQWAQKAGLATTVVSHTDYTGRSAFDAALQAEIDRFAPALVLLAGFMRILTPAFVSHYAGRLLNIHPSLLPAFPGLYTHHRALEAGCRFAGATVHAVSTALDTGPILAQAVVPILTSDDAQSLAARVLGQEHVLYPRAVEAWLAQHMCTQVQ